MLWLLYSLGTFYHRSRAINDEIIAIEEQNDRLRAEIRDKERRLQYLKTPQRIDKEAKIQMGKRQPEEKVLVFIDDRLPVLPTEQKQETERIIREDLPIIEKWRWLLFSQNESLPHISE